jgi:hypothetical protein
MQNNLTEDESFKKGLEWIAGMDDSVVKQQRLLKSFLEHIASQDIYGWLILSCSLARQAGDKLSDIDVALGIDDDIWVKGLDNLKNLAKGLGPVSDMLEHTLPDELGRQTKHLIVVFQDSLQLSLLTMPSSWIPGQRPMAVTLYDPEKHLSRPEAELASFKTTTPEQAYQWTFFAWLNLIDMTKYLDRKSLWEAHIQLERARNNIWSLWALANNLDYALYGVTQVIDDNVSFPKGIEKTVTDLNLDTMKKASYELADILNEVSKKASNTLPYDLPAGIADIAYKRLRGKL